MKFAVFLCLAFAIAVESFWRGETTNVLEDESEIDIKTEASLSVSFVTLAICPCRFLP